MQSTIKEIGDELHVMPRAGCLPRLAFVFGVFTTVMAFLPIQQRGGAEWYKVLPIGVGLLAASTYRSQIIIDQNAKNIFCRTKVLGYTKRTRKKPLARFSHVALGHQWKSTENGRHRVFYVSLSGDESFSILELSNIDICRNLAEQLASGLALPIHDSSSGGVAIIAADKIGLGLRRRLQAEDQPEEPTRIDSLACKIQTESSTLRISAPPAGHSVRHLLTFVPMMAFGGFIIWIVKLGFEPNRDFGERVIAVIGSLVACFFAITPIVFYVSRATRTVKIALNRTELQFESKTAFRSQSWNIDVEQVKDVFGFDLKKLGYRRTEAIGMAGGVAIRSERETLRFGDHLPQDEQQYLCQLLRYWISQY